MKRRVGLAAFSHLDRYQDETLWAVRYHELWKADSMTFRCQGCHCIINDHHFGFGVCNAQLPQWRTIRQTLWPLADQIELPEQLRWWEFTCQATPPKRGCPVKESFKDFTCLNAMMAEVPREIAEWVKHRSSTSDRPERSILKMQKVISGYVYKRRLKMYPKTYHPL